MKTRTLVVLALSLAAAGCQVATEAEPDATPGMRRDGGTTMGSGNRSEGAVAGDTLAASGGNTMGSGNRSEVPALPDSALSGDGADLVPLADSTGTGAVTDERGGNMMGSGN